MSIRVGQGYDVHQLVEERNLVLGGVQIPCEKGLSGHSDADVLLHAICDALLGAAALGDIGRHFPDTDSQYKGISSLKLLHDVYTLIADNNYDIENIDATIIAEWPKVAPFVDEMRHNIADTLNIQMSQISVKATTTEGLGFEGRKEGIAALALAVIKQK